MNRRIPFVVLVSLVSAFVMTTSAWAFFTSAGNGSGAAPVGALGAPSSVAGSPTGGIIALTWIGVTSPGSGPFGYYVTRAPVPTGTTIDVCGSPTSPVAASPTSCVDGSAPVGDYAYSVTAVFHSWTATSAPSNTVTVGKASSTTSLVVSTPTTTYGAEGSVSYSATVTPQIAVTVTGIVTVASGGVDLCSITLPTTSCSAGATALGASGTAYPVRATYGGDAEFTGSTSSAHDLTVGRDSTTTSVVAAPDSVNIGSEDTGLLTATIITGNGESFPAGVEQVTIDVGTSSCVAALVPGGTGAHGTCSIGASDLAVSGTPYAVSTSYGGDTDLTSSSATSVTGLTVTAVPVPSSLAVTTGVLDPATRSQIGYSQTLVSSGGSAPITWTVDLGSLPTGLSLDGATGIISGTVDPGAVTETFTVKATDTTMATAQAGLTITVYDAPVITTTSLAGARAGETGYSQTLTATGGAPGLSWFVTAGVLPDGLALDSTTGVVSGTLGAGATSQTITFTVFDAHGIWAEKELTLTVTNPFVRQASAKPIGNNASFQVNLSLGISAGHALALSVAQACTRTSGVPATPVDSHVTGVTGDSITWHLAEATGCTANGDAEVWYGLGTTTAGANTKITVTLNAVAEVQFANVTEYAGITGFDSTAGAGAKADGSGITLAPGSSIPSSAGELVVSAAFADNPTGTSLAGLVDPFVPLNLISPFRGFAAYAVGATISPLGYSFTQKMGGTSTAGRWSAVIAAFTFGP